MSDPAAPHPLPGSLRALVHGPGRLRIVTAGFPGRLDPAACAATLAGLRALGARRLVVLIEPREVGAGARSLLEAQAARLGLDLAAAPIVDFGVPGRAFLAWWQAGARDRAARCARGEALAFCCHQGAGRSGTMAALCLIEAGVTAGDAIARVRDAYPASIETRAQEDWLHARAARRQTPTGAGRGP